MNNAFKFIVSSAPIAQWLERRPSNPAVMRSSPVRGRTYMCLPYGVNSTLWQIKAMPGTSLMVVHTLCSKLSEVFLFSYEM